MHFADSHFGIEAYGKIDPATGLNSRLVDFRRSLDLAIDKALDANVDLALFGGDAYKSRDPNQTHQREFAMCIRRLTEASIPVVMVTGNHDLPNSRARAHAMEIYRVLGVDDIHILSRPEVITMETASGPIQIAGMPYLLRSGVLSRDECKGKSIQDTTDLMVQKYTEYIDYLARKLDPDLPSILLGHFWIKNAKVTSHGGYLNVAEPEVLVSTIANPAFDYVAMGHIHKFQDLNKKADPPVVYSGSTDRIDFSEKGEPKGFVIAEIEKGKATYEFVSVPCRRFVEIDVDADVEDPMTAILEAISQSDIEDTVVKISYHVPQEKLYLVRETEIREALTPAFTVVAITKDVRRDDSAVRNRLLTESLDPTKALGMFLETKEHYRKRSPELMEYAQPLIEELLAEEKFSVG